MIFPHGRVVPGRNFDSVDLPDTFFLVHPGEPPEETHALPSLKARPLSLATNLSTMKKIIFFSALVVAASLAATSASAQIKWTPQQLDVWKTETSIAALVVKGDIRGAQQYLGDDLEIWSTDSPVPVPRSSIVKWQDFVTARGTKVLFFDVIPMAIWVKDDFAYVYYHQRVVIQRNNEKPMRDDSHWTDALTRQNGKWVVVADFGGRDTQSK